MKNIKEKEEEAEGRRLTGEKNALYNEYREKRERARRRMSELNSVETYQGKDGIQTKEKSEIYR